MALRTILIAVGMTQGDKELNRAFAICQKREAHLSVLVIGVAPPPPASPYGVVSNDVWAGEIREGQETADAAATRIRDMAAERGVPVSVEPHYVDRGTVSAVAARMARYADITLIPAGDEEFGSMQDAVMNGALFESGRPVMLMPQEGPGLPEAKKIMVAWDASVEASKAVHSAVPMLMAAESVDLVLIDPVPSFDGHGPEPGSDLAVYLSHHGISATVHRLPREGMEVGELLRRTAQDLDADMIVMGGYGHSRLRQRIFGGTTTNMTANMAIPVLMAH